MIGKCYPTSSTDMSLHLHTTGSCCGDWQVKEGEFERVCPSYPKSMGNFAVLDSQPWITMELSGFLSSPNYRADASLLQHLSPWIPLFFFYILSCEQFTDKFFHIQLEKQGLIFMGLKCKCSLVYFPSYCQPCTTGHTKRTNSGEISGLIL